MALFNEHYYLLILIIQALNFFVPMIILTFFWDRSQEDVVFMYVVISCICLIHIVSMWMLWRSYRNLQSGKLNVLHGGEHWTYPRYGAVVNL